jgi:hypothetical protein
MNRKLSSEEKHRAGDKKTERHIPSSCHLFLSQEKNWTVTLHKATTLFLKALPYSRSARKLEWDIKFEDNFHLPVQLSMNKFVNIMITTVRYPRA